MKLKFLYFSKIKVIFLKKYMFTQNTPVLLKRMKYLISPRGIAMFYFENPEFLTTLLFQKRLNLHFYNDIIYR